MPAAMDLGVPAPLRKPDRRQPMLEADPVEADDVRRRLDRASLPTCHKRCVGASPAPGPPVAKLARGAPELATS